VMEAELYDDYNTHRRSGNLSLSLSLSLQSSSVEQVQDILMGNSRGGFPLPSSWFVITYCDQSFPSPWHCLSTAPPYPVLPFCPLSRAFPYPQPEDAGGRRSAAAICQSLTSADPTISRQSIHHHHHHHLCMRMYSAPVYITDIAALQLS